MDKKLIRILSPITLGVFALLDVAVIYFGIIAVSKISKAVTPITVFFAAFEIAAIIIAVIVNKEILSNGISFLDDEMEFTGVDENNIITYEKVKSVRIFKDNSVSLVKNFNDRHTVIHFVFTDDDTLSIDIGITTDKLVKTVSDELSARIPSAEITAEIKTKPDYKKNKDNNKSAD